MLDRNHAHHEKASKAKQKMKSLPGVIYIERKLHGEAAVISASLTVLTPNASASHVVAEAMEAAAREITDLGGIIGHIKSTVVVTTTKMISVTGEKAMVKDALECRVCITLAAIVFLIDKETAANIIKKALAKIRTQARTTGKPSNN